GRIWSDHPTQPRSHPAQPGARAVMTSIPTVAPGVSLPLTHKVIFQRSFVTKTYGSDSIHNDDYTKRNGYPGALISAYVLTGLVSEVLVNFFGESWMTTGKYHLKFTGKGLQQGNAVQCGALITKIE